MRKKLYGRLGTDDIDMIEKLKVNNDQLTECNPEATQANYQVLWSDVFSFERTVFTFVGYCFYTFCWAKHMLHTVQLPTD
jgi:hypothetical protein